MAADMNELPWLLSAYIAPAAVTATSGNKCEDHSVCRWGPSGSFQSGSTVDDYSIARLVSPTDPHDWVGLRIPLTQTTIQAHAGPFNSGAQRPSYDEEPKTSHIRLLPEVPRESLATAEGGKPSGSGTGGDVTVSSSVSLVSISSAGMSRTPSGASGPSNVLDRAHFPLHIVEPLPISKEGQYPASCAPAEPESQKRKRVVEDGNFTRRTIRRDETGKVQGVLTTFGRVQNVRGRMSDESRNETAMTRTLGACERCRRLKKKCLLAFNLSLYEPCRSCSIAKPYILRFPCSKSKISEATFFRLRPSFQSPLDSTSRKQVFELRDIPGPDCKIRKLELTQDVGPKLTVHVSRFVPMERDKTALKWDDDSGETHVFEMPPYCLTDLELIKANMFQYAREAGGLYLSFILKDSNNITWTTIIMALRFVALRKNSVVKLALELWSTSRMIERVWRICGTDTLDMPCISDTSSPDFGTIPVTPIMDTQLDQIVIQGILVPLRANLLRRLEGMVQNHRPDTWFEIYLTIFILLSSIEAGAAHAKNFAKDFGLRRRYPDMSEFEGYFHSCKILLSHFHFVCKGSIPIKMDWKKPEHSRIAKLDSEQIDFMERIKAMIKEKEKDVLALREKHRYETQLYWGHQLFFDNWDVCVTNIEDELP